MLMCVCRCGLHFLLWNIQPSQLSVSSLPAHLFRKYPHFPDLSESVSLQSLSEMFHVPVSPYCCVYTSSLEFFLVKCLTPLGLFPGLSVCFLFSLFSNCKYQSHLLFQPPVFCLHLGPILLNPNSNHLMSLVDRKEYIPYIHLL